MLKYEIRLLNWSKRRKANTLEKIEYVQLEDYKQKVDHFCKMIIKKENEDELIELNARVIYNDIQDFWLVTGINSTGDQCTIKLLK